jgi:Leucine-rich repeat (LRR) protein
MPNLKELNLSNNLIAGIPAQFWEYVPKLESINLNNNQIPQDEDLFSEVVGELSKVGGLSDEPDVGLKSLFINLTHEQQVDLILRKLPKLEFLNGLAVDRDELYSSGDNAEYPEDQLNQQ